MGENVLGDKESLCLYERFSCGVESRRRGIIVYVGHRDGVRECGVECWGRETYNLKMVVWGYLKFGRYRIRNGRYKI